ncbi:olfactory receptor 4B13-like [Amia ocellicauda]|uniref:olfactory receptor 4B13-like n=1 Tax=Amia ocellicauda TaxID=2972642 RepID=UPI0034642539
MENKSYFTSFILAGYREMDNLKYLYFTIFLLLYLIIIVASLFLIGVICVERSLHEPMYFFLCNLAVNGLYGSTGLLPSMLSHLMSEVHEVSLSCCLAQVFCLHTYGIAEFTILALMGYDRYVAICYPLQYNSIMSPLRVYTLITFSWLYPICSFSIFFISTARLTFCGRVLEKVYCTNHSVVKLSCEDTSIINIVGLVGISFTIVPQLLMLLYSYAQILIICLKSSRQSQVKALKTCTPHIVAVVNYSVGCLFEIIHSRFNMSHAPSAVRIVLALYFLIFPPLINPLIYGISIQAVRVKVIQILLKRKTVPETVIIK